jgi:ribose-phosphate pyrophosphokinase
MWATRISKRALTSWAVGGAAAALEYSINERQHGSASSFFATGHIAQADAQSAAPKSLVLDQKTLDRTVFVGGTSAGELASNVVQTLGAKLGDVTIRHFSDGEISCEYHETLRDKNIVIFQSTSPPINDNIMELLLLISAAKRAGADNVTAVIPYFAYRYHSRGEPISTKHQSRFLWSTVADFAKMIEAVGVDRIIALDLHSPGQEVALTFDGTVPVESISSNELMADYFAELDPPLGDQVVVIAANTNCVKKSVKFKESLAKRRDFKILDTAIFFKGSSGIGTKADDAESEFIGSDVQGADVIIVDNILVEGKTLSKLCRRLSMDGARRIFMCSNHGVFSPTAMKLVDLSPVERVVVTNSVPLPPTSSSKVVQTDTTRLFAKVISSELCRGDDEFKTVIPTLVDEDETEELHEE